MHIKEKNLLNKNKYLTCFLTIHCLVSWAQRRPYEISATKLQYTITESPTPTQEGCQGELCDINGGETSLPNSEALGFSKMYLWAAGVTGSQKEKFAVFPKVYSPKSPFSRSMHHHLFLAVLPDYKLQKIMGCQGDLCDIKCDEISLPNSGVTGFFEM